MTDLEVWLIGTAGQITAAVNVLTQTGRLVAASHPEPLFGCDTGRVRRYLRVAVTTAAPARRTTAGRAGLFDTAA